MLPPSSPDLHLYTPVATGPKCLNYVKYIFNDTSTLQSNTQMVFTGRSHCACNQRETDLSIFAFQWQQVFIEIIISQTRNGLVLQKTAINWAFAKLADVNLAICLVKFQYSGLCFTVQVFACILPDLLLGNYHFKITLLRACTGARKVKKLVVSF